MFNMYDISLPQQGGADCDGDIFLLSDDPMLTASKIEKPVILDVEDKATAQSKPYTKENIIEYEILTRDSRIGEITNAKTGEADPLFSSVSLSGQDESLSGSGRKTASVKRLPFALSHERAVQLYLHLGTEKNPMGSRVQGPGLHPLPGPKQRDGLVRPDCHPDLPAIHQSVRG